MWKIIEGSELVPTTVAQTTGMKILVMQFGNVEAEIEFFASLVKADGWLKGDHIDLGLYLIRKRQQQLEEVEIADWTTTDVFFMVPPCGMDWKNVYKVYAPFMLTKYKHWVAVMIDLVLCEIKVYDSKVSLIPDDIVKEELAPLSITLPNLLNTIFSTNSRGDCGMFVLKYIELFSAQLPLATCTSRTCPFFG
ncbi:hypothetical protein Prudu_102S002200 [Prunus dulcis]|uniref:Ubiquitin-like protease family profile domain-containing protein n=1 Tax=Prunus dulcis TaxID=3755 RepID=A0A5H2XM61_PRUDU|nr:hypothetical protein Prudu_102S002200 [Prunus dulcis]